MSKLYFTHYVGILLLASVITVGAALLLRAPEATAATQVTEIVVAHEDLDECISALAQVFIQPVVDGAATTVSLDGAVSERVVCVSA